MNKSILQLTRAVLLVGALAVAANSQESTLIMPLLPAASPTQPVAPVPNLRIGDFRVETLNADHPSPDGAPDASPDPGQQRGFMKRSLIRIGQDQKFIYKGPFEAHNLKWDAVILVGTGAFLAADRHIENNIPHSHFTVYQAISDTAIGGIGAARWQGYICTEPRPSIATPERLANSNSRP